MGFYDPVIFDLDGTLTDSREGVVRSVQYALARFGLYEDGENLLPFIGPPLMDSFMERCGFDEMQARLAVGYYREYYSERGIYENAVYPGIAELLARLQGEDRTLALATSKPTFFARQILVYFGLERFFAVTAGSNLDGTGASKSWLIRGVLGELEALTGETGRLCAVMIGDRGLDIIGARENGIDSIGAAYGYAPPRELEEAGPTHLARSVKEMAEILFWDGAGKTTRAEK